MSIDRRGAFLRFVAIALIALVGGFVATMFGGGVAPGGLNVSFRSGMLSSGACRHVRLSPSNHCVVTLGGR
jgi:hypothetical protein